MEGLTLKSSVRCFSGELRKYAFASSSTRSEMVFNIFFPSLEEKAGAVPGVVFLGGLTCTENNFCEKAGAFKELCRLGIALICPDTSPRIELPGDSDDWALGRGASYYLDASTFPWAAHYQMYSFITVELIALLRNAFPTRLDSDRLSIMGHSVGGHGALMIGLRNPQLFKSVSAFAPMTSPSRVPWGIKAFTTFLGSVEAGQQYDSELVARNYAGRPIHVMVDQGTNDKFFDEQLNQAAFVEACNQNDCIKLNYAMREGYDHGYYFVATFVTEHILFHAKHLGVTTD